MGRRATSIVCLPVQARDGQSHAPGRRRARGAAERSGIRRDMPARPADGAKAEVWAMADMATTAARKLRANMLRAAGGGVRRNEVQRCGATGGIRSVEDSPKAQASLMPPMDLVVNPFSLVC